MATLPQITLDFNRKIKLSNDGGEMIFREFDEKIGFSTTLEEYLQHVDKRHYYMNEVITNERLCFDIPL